jgi:hypothetical protein
MLLRHSPFGHASGSNLCTWIEVERGAEDPGFFRKTVSCTNFLITCFRAKECEQDIKHRHDSALIF